MQLSLQAALADRDPRLVSLLLGQWVHRHGLQSVEALWSELALTESEGVQWWQGRDAAPSSPVESQVPEVPEVPAPIRFEPQLPRAGRPAPAPKHPALVQLRSWLPNQESRRAA